jgi:hypothetical protein
MRKIILMISVSVDGFMEGPNRDMSSVWQGGLNSEINVLYCLWMSP